jgi:hypothetical protein
MNTNYFLFEDDNKIYQSLDERDKTLKTKLDEIKKWYEFEIKVLEEKERILKLMFNDLYEQRKMKEKNVCESS